MELLIPKVEDFEVTGTGADKAWQAMPWQQLARVGTGPSRFTTQAKMLYSSTGVYFLVDCEDRRLTCTSLKDFDDLYTEDVIEVFLWPDEQQILYFEYEISPLGAELPILVANSQGRFHGWLPWHYQGPRQTRKATDVRGGAKAPGSAVAGWSTEFFIPFALLVGMGNLPPKKGTKWRANIYRIDYDQAPCSQWAWCADTQGNFHNYKNFGTVIFE